jgi:signal recognition particle subunit SRP72
MSQYTPTTLAALLTALSLAAPATPHSEILTHANHVLRDAKSHVRTLHTKAVALINLDRYDDALAVLDLPELSSVVALERAYCLYKLGRAEGALAVATAGAPTGSARDQRGLKHVEAQAVCHPHSNDFSRPAWEGGY